MPSKTINSNAIKTLEQERENYRTHIKEVYKVMDNHTASLLLSGYDRAIRVLKEKDSSIEDEQKRFHFF
jgi:hypothetical protein